MKKIMLLFLFSIGFIIVQAQQVPNYEALSATTNMTFEEIQTIAKAHFENGEPQRGTGYKPFKRWEDWSRRNLNENGRIIKAGFAQKEFNKFKEEYGTIERAIDGPYTEMGPMSAINTSTWSSHLGRVSAISVDENDANHILVGAPAGGAWRTPDLGVTWTPLFDNEATIGVWAAEISHANSAHYFIGTNGGGIYKSTDSGSTWTQTTGASSSDRISKILMHPTDANILFALGEFFGDTYKSTDGGDNWTIVDDQSVGIYDIEFKPGDPTTVYISGNGFIRKSTDTGSTFSALTSGGTWNGSTSIMLGVTADDANYVYAVQQSGGGFDGLYLSTDAGSTWTEQMSYDGTNNIMGYDQTVQSGQAPRDMDVVVSPTDKSIVHVAGVETWKSTNSGTSFTQSTDWNLSSSQPFIHADIDLLRYFDNRLYAGTDGGIFYSDNEATDWSDITQGLGVRQLYRLGVSQTESDRVASGSQDNGGHIVKSGQWYDWLGADGMEHFIDWNNEDIMVGNTQNGSLYKSINGGASTAAIAQTEGGADGAWITPTEQDPTDADTYYQAKSEVYKSTDAGGSWNAISTFGALIYEMKIAPSDNQTIYVALAHDIYKTNNGGTTWTDVTPSQIYNWATYIAIHPTDPNRVALTLSGATEKVIETTNGGTSWNDISTNLPAIGSQCVMYENDSQDAMFVGMNPGAYFKDNTTGGNWTLINPTMPATSVTEMEARNGVLYIATYGRGLWKVDLMEGAVADPNCALPALAIDGSAPHVSTITIADGGIITDVDIELNINHTWVGDLDITLEHNGVTVLLIDEPGDPAIDDDGCGESDVDCTLDDEGTDGPVENACATGGLVPAIGGFLVPQEALAAFDGLDAAGDWTLTVTDVFPGADDGTLNEWCLNITTENECNMPALFLDGSAAVTSVTTLGIEGIITDVNVEFDMSHTWVGDVTATLEHLGTTVTLFDQPGAGGYGCGDDDFDCIFDDQSTNGTIENVCNNTTPAYSGDYNPENPLSAFIGMERAGDWTLTLTDAFSGADNGTLNEWCLIITTGDPCPSDLAGGNALMGTVTGTEIFVSEGDIESTQTIETGADVIYDTDQTITMDQPFEVKAAATFETKSDGCNN